MKMKTGNEYRRLSCDVWTAKTLSVRKEVPCGLGSDAIGYAACRFLTKCEVLCRDYVEQSYRLRLRQGKGRRPVESRFTAPAHMLELPGAMVAVQVLITPAGVEVQSVSILGTERTLEPRPAKKKKPAIGVYWSDSFKLEQGLKRSS